MLRDILGMAQGFLPCVTREFPSLEDLTPLGDDDAWPAQFNNDKKYLEKAIEDLDEESKSVQEIVRNQ